MQRRESGIASLLGQLREPEDVDGGQAGAPPPPAPQEKAAARAEPRRRRSAGTAPAPAPAREEIRSAGRARVGKRSNPDYGLRGLWLRTDTYLDVTDRLRRRREYADASELVQALLEEWLAKR